MIAHLLVEWGVNVHSTNANNKTALETCKHEELKHYIASKCLLIIYHSM